MKKHAHTKSAPYKYIAAHVKYKEKKKTKTVAVPKYG